jgi:chaperonin GroES
MNLKPLNDFVIVQPIEARKQTETGIFLTEPENENHKRGTVLAIGPGERQNGTCVPIQDVQEGDTVLYDELSADPLPHDGHDYEVMRQGALILVIPD